MQNFRRIAATAVLVDRQTLLPPSCITIDSSGTVVDITPLSDFGVEPAATRYFSGIITPDVDMRLCTEGISLQSVVSATLCKGYSGTLLLWQNISATDCTVQHNTTVVVL